MRLLGDSYAVDARMVTVVEALSLILVSLLWGCTNPFLKKGSEGIENVTETNRVSQLLAEIKFLLLNVKYLVPFLLNQSGSLVYFYTLSTTEYLRATYASVCQNNPENVEGTNSDHGVIVLNWSDLNLQGDSMEDGQEEERDTRPNNESKPGRTTDLSVAVPVANSLTFLCTLLTGKLLGEDIGGKQAVLGMFLTMTGITLCVISSIEGTDTDGANQSDYQL